MFLPTRGCDLRSLAFFIIFFFSLVMFSSCYQARDLSAMIQNGAKCTIKVDTVDVNVISYQKSPKRGTV